nr:U1 small nuclear ribonucleoprotein C-like [Leptinotarsa decemlineata]
MFLLKVSLLVTCVVAGREHATDIEIQQVEVFEVPWQEEPSEPQQPQQPPQPGYGPPQQEYGPPKAEYGPPQPEYGPPQHEYGPPQQEYGPPQPEYGPPKPEYGPPQPEYGPPPVYGPPAKEATTTESGTTTTDLPTTTDYPVNGTSRRFEKLQKEDGLSQRGVYYIYHPEGLLQRVVYSTKDDVRKMEYSAKLKYENVEPVRGPIYSYDPRSFEFQRIAK